MALQHERVAAADRLVEADEDLAVGEVARGLRGDRDVEFLGDLLGQFGVRATREEHQVLAVVGPVGAHSVPSPVGDRYGPMVRMQLRRALPGCQNPNGNATAHGRLGRPRVSAPSAASAGAPAGRLRGRAAGSLALHPALDVALRTRRHRQRARRHVLADHGARAGVGAVADGDRCDEHGVGAGAHVRTDRGAPLGFSVVVDEHARRADVAVLADVGVADVGQVRHLGAGADRRRSSSRRTRRACRRRPARCRAAGR